MTYRIGIIGGDGIGPEVTAEAVKCVDASGVAYEGVPFDLGWERYSRDGAVLPDADLEEIRKLDAIMLGAVGAAAGQGGGIVERGILLRLRFELDLYVNLRPFTAAPDARHPDIDLTVIRENTEGVYAGEGGFLRKGTPHEVATQGSVNTRMGVERCVRFAFDLARSHARKHVTLVHKTNVLTFAGDLWQRTFDDVAVEYPDVETAYNHVDAACIYFVSDPGRYDVIVTDNMFGDIITDLGGAVAGGVGPRRFGQPQPGPHRPVALRAGARLGARHRRHRAGRSAGGHRVGCDDVGVPRRNRRRRTSTRGRRRIRRPHRDHRRDRRRDRRENLMPIQATDKIWMDGELVAWDEARVHVLTHTLHYGSGVFEGIRAYPTKNGPAVFRLTDHIKRLHDSAELFLMEMPYSVDELVEATRETVARQQRRVLLHPADRLPRVRRDGAQPAAVRGEGVDRGVAVGLVPR